MNRLRPFLVLIALGIAFGSGAEPSKAFRTLTETPPNALDLFLFRIHESAKCGNWLGSDDPPELCLASVSYAPGPDVLNWHFQMSAVHEDLVDFTELEEEQREFRLMGRLDRVVQLAGVEGRWGLLHSVPLSLTAGTQVDVQALRKSLAARSAVHLHVTYGSTVYNATRDVDGFTELETIRRDTDGQ